MSDDQPQRPTNDDHAAWKAYWEAQDMPWRTEPEIDEVRQAYLTERRAVTPDIEKDIYPFKDIKLARSDVEWLLATHEDGRGPVWWEEEQDKPEGERRWGLDLRRADLREADLSRLPFACLRCGFEVPPPAKRRREQWQLWQPHLVMYPEGAHLEGAHLEGTHLEGAHLEGASLADARLEGAYLDEAYLERSDLRRAYLDADTTLEGARLGSQRRDLYTKISGKKGFHMMTAWALAQLSRLAALAGWLAYLLVITLGLIKLLFGPSTDGKPPTPTVWAALPSNLSGPAFLEILAYGVGLGVTVLIAIASTFTSRAQGLVITIFVSTSPFMWGVGDNYSGALLADVHWGNANLAVVEWRRVRLLGDELRAWLLPDEDGRRKGWGPTTSRRPSEPFYSHAK